MAATRNWAYYCRVVASISVLFSTFLVISSSKHEEDPCAISTRAS